MQRYWVLVSAIWMGSVGLMAGEYDSLMNTVKKSWPDRTNVAVVCDNASSKSAVGALAAASSGMKISLMDAKGPQDMGKVLATLSARKPDLVVLIAGDRVAGDGTPAATFLIQRLASLKVPTASITEAGLRQGAVLAVGPGTGGKLLVNPKAAAITGVSLPENGTAI